VTFNIEWWDIDKVIPYAKNARKIRQSAIDKVAASIAEFGWRQPIVVDAKGVIAVGHVRWGAAKKLKLEKVPVHVASDLTDAQIKAYRLMDNRSNEETDWDTGCQLSALRPTRRFESIYAGRKSAFRRPGPQMPQAGSTANRCR
jgi:hypothetical protein